MKERIVVIGGGLAGLTSGALLARRGLAVTVVENGYNPGGTCGIFRRKHITYDQGAAMLYGFGEHGFNAHRFVFNALEEPIDIIRHDLLYAVNFRGHRIPFPADIDEFITELARVFPKEEENLRRFYHDMQRMYHHVLVETPVYTTADETDKKAALQSIRRHPVSYLRFLGYLNKSAKALLQRYFTDPEIFQFFDKLTSTYCYATVEEAPAVMAAVMFVDNHEGGSYYPAGSTLFVPGKLEKVIEEHGGRMCLGTKATEIRFENGRAAGVRLDTGEMLDATQVIYSGTVWNLYDGLIPAGISTRKERVRARAMVPTYPSVVFYATVDKDVIPDTAAPIEMLVANPAELDENEVTVYIASIDDGTLCGEDEHTVVAVGPSFRDWPEERAAYREQKEEERIRLTAVLERKFPGFSAAVRHAEVATPRTVERYTMKNGGAVAGPKQMLGQHMFKRLRTRTRWPNLFCCGESTVMGTGTPTVTVSGVAAANAVLKRAGLVPYVYEENRADFVRLVPKPFTRDRLFADAPPEERAVLHGAMRCRLCESPACTKLHPADIRGIMRRVVVGNFIGAARAWHGQPADADALKTMEEHCIWSREGEAPVPIRDVIALVEEKTHGNV